ncbi:single-stranded DNA-binding protein [Tsukamurella sp. PLM1]|uniref:single-stranded DNA-binding protein n=1 Tax=Tsukamurella sp. PLM1 TaxID=2929795 RepID=UPI00205C8667|nr:single-stranded DNA-binding protein [Tsukamurella sp. PLM1]BDH56611.1 hypothetical protein MTP03_15500 [Tsukamurella sp. PLM1]
MPGVFIFAAGNVTNDLTYRQSDKDPRHDFLSFTMAANNGFWEGESWRQTSTVWLNVKAFGALARNARGVIAKGRPVMVHGELKHETFDGTDGHKHSSLDLKADAIGLNLRMCAAQYVGKEQTRVLPPVPGVDGAVGAGPDGAGGGAGFGAASDVPPGPAPEPGDEPAAEFEALPADPVPAY